MELKLMQSLVQKAETVQGFNYAYCKILYNNAVELLKTDIIDRNGDPFPIDENSVALIAERVKNISNVSPSIDSTEEERISYRINFVNKCFLHQKEDSILKNIFNSLSDQLVERFDFSIERNPDSYDAEIEGVLLFLVKVKKYLAMFEE